MPQPTLDIRRQDEQRPGRLARPNSRPSDAVSRVQGRDLELHHGVDRCWIGCHIVKCIGNE